ncbi:MAG TPA: hypothetical protein VGK59_01770 [Ohtaekwangia sp.]
MKTLLILAYECAPYNRPGSTIGAQRPFQFAKQLPAFGWRTIVLCADFKDRYTLSEQKEWENSIESFVHDKVNLWNDVNETSLVIPLPSLQHADWIDKAWLQSVCTDERNGTFTARSGLVNTLKRKGASFLKIFKGDNSQSWQPVAYVAACQIFKDHKIDFILAEHGPDAGFFVARKLSRQFGIKWCVDFRDPVLRFHKSYSRCIVKYLYRSYLSSSSFIIAVHKAWARLDREDFKKESLVITNGFDPDEFDRVSKLESEEHNQALCLFYGGNINFEYQALTVLFKALALLNKDKKNIEFVYAGNAHRKVQELSELHGVQQCVTSLEMMPREKYLKLVLQADMLVILSFVDVNNRFFMHGLYPGKVFEYFGLRKPIICVPGDDGILDELLIEVGAGKSFKDPSVLSLYLSEMMACKQRGEVLPYNPSDKIEDYSRARQAQKLAECLNSYSVK